MHEIELKFGIAPDRLQAVARAVTRSGSRTERLRAAYFDSSGGRLATKGMSLRLRQEGQHWIQTAKASTGHAISRLEDNVPVPAPLRGRAPALDLSRHDHTPLGAALRKALGGDDGARLELRFQTDVERRSRTLRAKGARIELALDVGEVTASGLSEPIRELEMELKSGPMPPLLDLAARWVGQHGLWLSTLSKAERGALLREGRREPGPTQAAAPKLPAPATARAFMTATIESCMKQVLANASAVAAGSEDAEIVHQLRVGVRRLRTALRELSAFAQGIDPAWEEGLRKVFHELGDFRDRAVVMPQIHADLGSAGAPELKGCELSSSAARRPTTVVRDAAFQRLLLALVGFEHALPGSTQDGGDDPRVVVARRLAKLLQRVARDGKRFADLDITGQHRVRKWLKRLRYLSEFAVPLFGEKQVDRYLENWRQAQDALGIYNDQCVAANLFRADAAAEPNAWFAVGWLEAQKGASVKRCRRALRKAARARPFWSEAAT